MNKDNFKKYLKSKILPISYFLDKILTYIAYINL